jgi:hypothetical protein
MIEYWAVLGLAIIDEEFLETLAKAKRDIGKLRKVVKDYGFRLSRYEMGELQRVINAKDHNAKDPENRKGNVLDLMRQLHHLIWFEEDPCWPAMTPNAKYRHPYLVYYSKHGPDHPGKNDSPVLGYVDPVTGKPLKTEKKAYKNAKGKAQSHSRE